MARPSRAAIRRENVWLDLAAIIRQLGSA